MRNALPLLEVVHERRCVPTGKPLATSSILRARRREERGRVSTIERRLREHVVHLLAREGRAASEAEEGERGEREGGRTR